MPDPVLQSAVASIPPGAWAVGVSGGADSVALLLLLHARSDHRLHVVHLDHQTRGEDSAGDAEFVRRLAARLGLACTSAHRSDVEATMPHLPENMSSRYRAARMALFRRVAKEENLKGVILAHHAGDQAETILQRLLRFSGPMGLAGMIRSADIGGLTVLRPLLGVAQEKLRAFLAEAGQAWREDASNAGDEYFRNRLRRLLQGEPTMGQRLRDLGDACRELRDWVRATAPELEQTFPTRQLADLPSILAAESARRWLTSQGVDARLITPAVLNRLIHMASDAASPAKAQFPSGIGVRRRGGRIEKDAR